MRFSKPLGQAAHRRSALVDSVFLLSDFFRILLSDFFLYTTIVRGVA